MILYYLLVALLGAINLVTFFLPVLKSLPFGMDGILSTFVGTIHGVVVALPILTIPLATFTLFYTLVGLRFMWEHVKWLIERIH